ncbi:MAG: outer membrane protein assembly factor BamA [Pseudomonadota bacterium]
MTLINAGQRSVWQGVRLGWIAAALFLALTALFSEQAKAQSIPVGSITIQGNQRVERATILSFAGLETGTAVTAGQLNAAGQRLRESGLFESVEIRPSGGGVLISVVEFPTINLISIEGNRSLDDDVLSGLIQSQSRRVFNPQIAERDAQVIVDAYLQAGRVAASVTPRIIRRSDNRVDLVFEVVEGGVIEIERIGFVGNRAFSDRRLRRELQTKQAGVFRQILRSDTFVADRIAFDEQLLADFYRSRGYIDFQVLSATTELTRERDGFLITFNVQEGQQFRLGRITTSSALPDVDPADFAEEIKIRTGMVYSPALIDQTIARLENLAVAKRLNFIRVDPVISRNDREGTLDVNFEIVRGERIFIERIDIEGNTSTLDRVVRREFQVVEGDPFNPREIRQAAERIRALGYFETSEVNAREGSGPDRVIIDVDVVEQPTGALTFGANFSPDEGFGFAIGFSERNFLGRGQVFSVDLNTTEDDRTGIISFTEPYLLGRDLSLTLDLFTSRTSNSDTQDFDTETTGFGVGIGFPVGEFSRLRPRYRFSNDEVSGVSPLSSNIIQEEVGERSDSQIGYEYVYDTRRRGLDPTRGVLFQFSQDFAGVGGDTEYIRTEATIRAERLAFSEEVRLSAALLAGAVVALDDTVTRSTDRYFARSRILRGFESNGFGPRDLNVPNQDSLGGNYFVALRLDADFPLGLPEEYGLTGGLFFDIGSIWGLDNTNGGLTVNDPVDDGFNLRSTIGVSIFWTTVLGPLRFDFSTPVQVEDFDRTRTFDLTVSTTF